MKYSIRLMQERDIPQVLQIDREAFPTQWPCPTYTSFKSELNNRLARYIVACKQRENSLETTNQTPARESYWQRFPLVKLFVPAKNTSSYPAASTGQDYILGYSGFWIMLEEAHLTTIAVRETYRRQGIGELLLISVIDLAAQLGARIITLEVRFSNRTAQYLYEKYHFRPAGIRRRYYSDNNEDALVMTTETITSVSFQSHFQQLREAYYEKRGETFTYAHPNRS